MDDLSPQKQLDRYILDYMRRKGLHKTASVFRHQVLDREPVVGISLSDMWRMYYQEHGHLHQRNEVQINPRTQTPINQQLVPRSSANITISPAGHHPVDRMHLNMGQEAIDQGKNVASNPQNRTPINQQLVPQGLGNINVSPSGHHPVDRIQLKNGQQTINQGKNVSSNPQNRTPRNQTLAPQSSSQQVITRQNLLDRYLLDYMKRKGLNKTAAVFAHQVVNQEPVVGNSLSDCWRMYNEEYGHLHQHNEVQINMRTQTPMNQQLVPQDLGNLNISPALHHPVDGTHLNMGQQTIDKGKNVASDPQNLTPRNQTLAPQSSSQQILNKFARRGQINIQALRSILRTTLEQQVNPPRQPSTDFLDESGPHERQIGPSQFPGKAFRRNNGSQRPTTGQLRLKPKSNEGGNVAKAHTPVEISDDENA